MKNKLKALALLLAFTLCFMGGFPPAYGAEAEKRIIRVAYPVQDGLTGYDNYGNRCGYTYEYLEEVAQYTGWDYEFIEPSGNDVNENLTTMMEMLQRGEIDLMGGILYSDAMGEIYDYTAHNYGTVETVLQVLYDSTEEITIDARIMQKMRIAVIKTSKRLVSELEEYCKINLIEPEYVYCDNLEAQVQALRDGQADAMLNSGLNYTEGVRTLAAFSSKPFYFISSKGADNTIIAELNAAISSIEQTDPYFSKELFQKYFAPPNDVLLLTDKEKDYLSQAGTLNVGILTDQPPFQYKEQNTRKGISVDLLRYITQQTGLQFEFVEASTPEELYAMADDGKIDLLAGILYDYNLAQAQNISMTRPYVSSQYVIMLNKDITEENIVGKRLALVSSSAYNGKFIGKVIKFPTVHDCIDAVRTGAADYTYVDNYTAQYYLNLTDYRDMRTVPQTYNLNKTCFGIVKPFDTELLRILNKSILTISEENMQAIINENTTPRPRLTLMNLLRENPVESILIVSLFLLVVIALLLMGLYQRNKQNKKTTLELKKHLRVYQLVNDYFFEYDFRANTLITAIPNEDGKRQTKLEKYDFSRSPVSPFEKTLHSSSFLKAIRSQEDGEREIQFEYNGRPHWFYLALETVYNESGEPAYAIGKIKNIDEEKQEKEKLRQQAQMDSLTHILNAETSLKRIVEDLDTMSEGQSGALLLIDIDKFKLINDNYGHLEGDSILKQFALLLRDSFRSEDIVGRPGGDEFIVYMKAVNDRKILHDKCNALCHAASQILINGQKSITISVGAALASRGQSYSELYQKADSALYLAKEHGRNRFEIA